VDDIFPDGEPVVKRRLLLRRVQGLLADVGDEGFGEAHGAVLLLARLRCTPRRCEPQTLMGVEPVPDSMMDI
jgi:hypothetical protein